MRGFFPILNRAAAWILCCTLWGCTNGGSASNKSTSKSTTSELLVSDMKLNTFKTGTNFELNTNIYNNIHYTRFNQISVQGTCSGDVKKIAIVSNGATNETLDCSSGSWSWIKSIANEGAYLDEFVPQNAENLKVETVPSVFKTFVFDTTSPNAPTFTQPSTGNYYTITDATSKMLIKGQVLKEIKRVTGPGNINLVLQADPDGVHLNFAFLALVPIGAVTPFTFTAFDPAGNSASDTLAIESKTDVQVVTSTQELGSSVVVNQGITIHSSVGFMLGSSTNSNVRKTIGGASVIKER